MAEPIVAYSCRFADCLLRAADPAQLPKSGGLLLARHLPLREGDRVLDLGCGAGLVGILAARRGHRVVATDLLPTCCQAARENAALNGVEDRLEVRAGDLFAPVADERFDLIATNPPQMPTPPDRSWPDDEARMNDAGPDGWALLERIIPQAPAHLTPGGRLVFTLFEFLGPERALEALRAAGLAGTILAQEDQHLPRLARERLAHLRSLPGGSLLPPGLPASCARLLLCGERGE